MKFKFFFLIFFLINNCANNTISYNKKAPFNTTGFAYIYNENDYNNKIVSSKFDTNSLIVAHNILSAGKLIKITNPENKKFIVLNNKKRVKYPSFYKVMLTPAVQKKLNLDNDFPFIDLEVIKKNKSFVAKKATTFSEEKKILDKVPVEKVKIDNLSVNNKNTNKKKYLFSILIAEFYSKDTAFFLKKRLIEDTSKFNNNNLSIKVSKKNKFQLLSGPYKSINLIKNDYTELENLGFEELDIITQ